MLNAERREAIKRKIAAEKRVLIGDLCAEFNTSPVTIRKDLDALEQKGVLTRVHGGAILNQTAMSELSIAEKEKIHFKEKERIARFAVSLIKEGDIVILDSGFTAIHIARKLKIRSGVKIITGGLNVANEIAGSDNELIMIGGVFNEETFAFSGGFAEEVIRNSVADKLFLGVDGVDLKKGLTAYNYEEARLNRLMISAASEVILIADSSKFGKKAMGYIGGLNEVQRVITDNKISKDYVKAMEKMNIKINLV